VRESIESAAAQLIYLPPYSPDLNPIEHTFSKFKWLLKTAEERAVFALWQTCGKLLEMTLQPSEVYGTRNRVRTSLTHIA